MYLEDFMHVHGVNLDPEPQPITKLSKAERKQRVCEGRKAIKKTKSQKSIIKPPMNCHLVVQHVLRGESVDPKHTRMINTVYEYVDVMRKRSSKVRKYDPKTHFPDGTI